MADRWNRCIVGRPLASHIDEFLNSDDIADAGLRLTDAIQVNGLKVHDQA